MRRTTPGGLAAHWPLSAADAAAGLGRRSTGAAGRTQSEVAGALGISRQAVGQRLQAAQWAVEEAVRPTLTGCWPGPTGRRRRERLGRRRAWLCGWVWPSASAVLWATQLGAAPAGAGPAARPGRCCSSGLRWPHRRGRLAVRDLGTADPPWSWVAAGVGALAAVTLRQRRGASVFGLADAVGPPGQSPGAADHPARGCLDRRPGAAGHAGHPAGRLAGGHRGHRRGQGLRPLPRAEDRPGHRCDRAVHHRDLRQPGLGGRLRRHRYDPALMRDRRNPRLAAGGRAPRAARPARGRRDRRPPARLPGGARSTPTWPTPPPSVPRTTCRSEVSANCVVVAGRRGEVSTMAACMVLATDRADVNKTVRKHLDVRKISFASMDDAVAQTGMEYGGITPIGLPDGWPILVDEATVAARVGRHRQRHPRQQDPAARAPRWRRSPDGRRCSAPGPRPAEPAVGDDDPRHPDLAGHRHPRRRARRRPSARPGRPGSAAAPTSRAT